MRPSLQMKTMFRSPVRTLLTIILLSAVTFALFSQAAEYAITVREMNKAALQTKGIGAVELENAVNCSPSRPLYIHTDPRIQGMYSLWDASEYIHRYKPLTKEQIDEISMLPFISSVSTRYMTAGLSDKYPRMLDGESNRGGIYYDYTRRLVIEGTLTDIWYAQSEGETNSGAQNFNRLIIEDVRYITDTPTYTPPLKMRSLFNDDKDRYQIFVSPREHPIWGTQFMSDFISPGYEAELTNYIFGTDFLETLKPGSRYAFVAQAKRPDYGSGYWFERPPFLGDYFTDLWCQPVQLLDGKPDNYIETDEFADLRELIEITNADLNTLDLVYTDDMSAIMRFAVGDMAIIDGRELTADDSENDAHICVISQRFAHENELEVGDTLTVTLGTELFEQYKGLGAVAVTRERYKPATKEVSLEIVGIWKDVDTETKQREIPNWCYSVNTLFVPKSLLPVEESALSSHLFSPSEVSFTVDNVWDIKAFNEETVPILEDMGLTLIFSDSGWSKTEDEFRESERLSLIDIAGFSITVAVATWFAVYLFIGQKKKEYAIMRALGTTHQASAKALMLPLMSVAVISVLAGISTAWAYTTATVGHNKSILALSDYSLNTSIPLWLAAGCLMAELLLIMLFALVMLRNISAKSTLALLQGGTREARAYKVGSTGRRINEGELRKAENGSGFPAIDAPASEDGHNVRASTSRFIQKPDGLYKKNGTVRFVIRHVIRHAHRSAVKSSLSLLLAALLLGAVGYLALLKQAYTNLVENTKITASFAGGLPLSAMHNISNNSQVSGTYYETLVMSIAMDTVSAELVATNNIARFIGEEPDIVFLDGYDISCTEKYGNFIVAGKSLMERYGFKLGDTVVISNVFILLRANKDFINRYRNEHPDDTKGDQEILDLSRDRIIEYLSSYYDTYTIIGSISTPSGDYDTKLFTPGDRQASWGLVVAEISPSDNMRFDEFCEYGRRIADSTGSIRFVIGPNVLEGPIKTLGLIKSFYPGALIAAMLIGGFLCCMMIMQRSKDAAIMRIQGTTKRITSTILTFEQLLLSIVGLILGVCVLLVYKWRELAQIKDEILIYISVFIGVIFLCAAVCSTLATQRSVLDLLQTKE